MFDLAALEPRSPAPSSPASCTFLATTGSTNTDAIAAAARQLAPRMAPSSSPTSKRRAAAVAITAGTPLPAKGLYVSVLSARKFPPSRLAALAARRGPRRRRCHSHSAISGSGSRSALAQRSLDRPAQNRRHSCRGKTSSPKGCPTQWSGIGINVHQRAFPSGPCHARNLARP